VGECIFLFTPPLTQDEELHAVLDGRLVGVGSREIDHNADAEGPKSASPVITRAQVTETLRITLEAAAFAGDSLLTAVAAAEDTVTKQYKCGVFIELGFGTCSRFLSAAVREEGEGAAGFGADSGMLSLGQVLRLLAREGGASALMEFVVHCCRTIDGEDLAAKIACLQTPLGIECLERAVTQHFKVKLKEFGFSSLRPLVARLSVDILRAPPRDPVPLAALLLAGALRQVEIESGGAGARDLDMNTHAAATHASLGELDTTCAVRALRHAPLLADLEDATKWIQVLSTPFLHASLSS
jgi:hypothetical protein